MCKGMLAVVEIVQAASAAISEVQIKPQTIFYSFAAWP